MLVYLLGPGFGESTVVLFPDGRVMVVDACVRAGVNLPAELLKALGLVSIDLLVVTHPDLDHLRGMKRLLESFSPARVWHYPMARSIRDLVVQWTASDRVEPWRERLLELRAVHDALFRLADARNIVKEVGVGSISWPQPLTAESYTVACVAPSDWDQMRLSERVGAILRVRGDHVEVDQKLAAQLLGERPLDDHPNTLSIALSLQWRTHKVLLGGDVENGASHPFSGWKGVIHCLEQDQRLALIEQTSLVKVAHHGSTGAFWEPAWRIHARSDGSTVAILTPFNRSTPPLPSTEVLSRLRSFASRLGITVNARGARERALGAGWKRSASTTALSPSPMVAAVLHDGGGIELHAGSFGAVFARD